MNSNIVKLTHLSLNGSGSCNFNSFTKKMEDFDQMATIDMGKLEWSYINSDNEKYHAVAITNMVINHNRYFPSTSVEQL